MSHTPVSYSSSRGSSPMIASPAPSRSSREHPRDLFSGSRGSSPMMASGDPFHSSRGSSPISQSHSTVHSSRRSSHVSDSPSPVHGSRGFSSMSASPSPVHGSRGSSPISHSNSPVYSSRRSSHVSDSPDSARSSRRSSHVSDSPDSARSSRRSSHVSDSPSPVHGSQGSSHLNDSLVASRSSRASSNHGGSPAMSSVHDMPVVSPLDDYTSLFEYFENSLNAMQFHKRLSFNGASYSWPNHPGFHIPFELDIMEEGIVRGIEGMLRTCNDFIKYEKQWDVEIDAFFALHGAIKLFNKLKTDTFATSPAHFDIETLISELAKNFWNKHFGFLCRVDVLKAAQSMRLDLYQVAVLCGIEKAFAMINGNGEFDIKFRDIYNGVQIPDDEEDWYRLAYYYAISFLESMRTGENNMKYKISNYLRERTSLRRESRKLHNPRTERDADFYADSQRIQERLQYLESAIRDHRAALEDYSSMSHKY